MIDAVDEAAFHWVSADRKDYGNFCRRGLGRPYHRNGIEAHNNRHAALHQFANQCRQMIDIVSPPAEYAGVVLLFNQSHSSKAIADRCNKYLPAFWRPLRHVADNWYGAGLLRASSERPYSRCS